MGKCEAHHFRNFNGILLFSQCFGSHVEFGYFNRNAKLSKLVEAGFEISQIDTATNMALRTDASYRGSILQHLFHQRHKVVGLVLIFNNVIIVHIQSGIGISFVCPFETVPIDRITHNTLQIIGMSRFVQHVVLFYFSFIASDIPDYPCFTCFIHCFRGRR